MFVLIDVVNVNKCLCLSEGIVRLLCRCGCWRIILLPMQSRVYRRSCMSQSFLWKSHGNCQCQHGHVTCAYVGLRAWVHVIRHVKGQSNACHDSSSPCMKFPCTKHESSADEQSSKRWSDLPRHHEKQGTIVTIQNNWEQTLKRTHFQKCSCASGWHAQAIYLQIA